MNYKLPRLLGGFLITFVFPLHIIAAPIVHISAVNINPLAPMASDLLTADTFLEFPTSGYSIRDVVGFGTFATISVTSPTGIVLPVFMTKIVNTEIGKLPAGDYKFTVRLFLDGRIVDSAAKPFSVTPTPEPASVQLLVVGFLSWIVRQSFRLRKFAAAATARQTTTSDYSPADRKTGARFR